MFKHLTKAWRLGELPRLTLVRASQQSRANGKTRAWAENVATRILDAEIPDREQFLMQLYECSMLSGFQLSSYPASLSAMSNTLRKIGQTLVVGLHEDRLPAAIVDDIFQWAAANAQMPSGQSGLFFVMQLNREDLSALEIAPLLKGGGQGIAYLEQLNAGVRPSVASRPLIWTAAAGFAVLAMATLYGKNALFDGTAATETEAPLALVGQDRGKDAAPGSVLSDGLADATLKTDVFHYAADAKDPSQADQLENSDSKAGHWRLEYNPLPPSARLPAATDVLQYWTWFERGDLDALKNSDISFAGFRFYREDGHTPLSLAIEKGSTEWVAALLAAGADHDYHTGETPLIKSVATGQQEIAKMLLSSGADPNLAANDGRTPLMASVRNRHLQVSGMLLDHGADANHQAGDGWTALAYAVWNGDRDAVLLLMRAGADPFLRNAEGQNVYDIARDKNHPPTLFEATALMQRLTS